MENVNTTNNVNLDNTNVPVDHHLYRSYELDEESQRINQHYDLDPRFYFTFIGGEWNSYSALYWTRDDMTVTEAEESKFDLMAKQMGLKAGMRIMDVGAGWGGPLTYLCKTYGLTGVGLMLSEKQRDAATERAKRYGVDAKFYVTHWENFTDEEGFDAVYTDEVAVHFNDLIGFFRKAWSVLKPGGVYFNKEMHYTHARYTYMNRAMEHINGVFGFTGNYRLLHDELTMLHDAGFELQSLLQIPIMNYGRTIDGWISRFFQNEKELAAMSDPAYAKAFRKYMKLCRIGFNTNTMSMDLITGRKINPDEKPW
jgi:cyclopropane-fatty-acyl-phospholipid synthase